MSVSRVQLRIGEREAVFGPGLPEIVVGTDRACFVRVTDHGVAARHVVISYAEDGWAVEAVAGEDVFVDGERMTRRVVDGPLRLRLGDAEQGPLLELGPAIEQRDLMTRNFGAAQTEEAGPSAELEAATERRARSVRVSGERLLIGRAADSDLVVDDVLVSRRHAEVRAVDGGAWEVVDLGSHNGTFVNGQRVDRERFATGDVLMIGRHTFRLDGDTLREDVDTGEVAYAALGLTVRLPDAGVLLEGVTFTLDSKSLLGVVGPSGSGKSTLIRALTGFQMATEGDVRYGDASLYAQYDALRRRVGYVPQDDVVHEHLTVRRALEYSADLRFPADVRPDERRRRVDEVLDELALTRSADVVVGRLSGGQRKRVSVALELLTEPSLLFLDEPTSGLDPNYERSLMELFRGLADNGRTVVVVTHSVESLHLCDRVLIMAPGGRVAYYGPPQFMTAYFEVEDMQDVFRALVEQSEVDWAERYRQHAFHRDYVLRGGSAAEPPAQLAEAPRASTDGGSRLRSRAWWSQFSTLTRRYAALTVADRANLTLLVAQAPVLGLLLLAALPTGELGSSAPGVFRLLSQASLVLLVVILGVTWLGLSNAVREIAKEMPIFRRERAAGVAISAYVASKAVVLGVITCAQAAVLVTLALLRQGGPDSAVLVGWPLGELLVVGAMTGLAAMALGLFVSAVARTPDRATTVLPIVLVVLLVLALGGVVREIGQRPVLKQLGYVAITQWGFSAAASTSSLNDLQAVTGVLTRVPSVDIDNPTKLFDALNKGERGDARWDHNRTAWLRDVGALFLLTIAGLIGTWLALRREGAGRRR